MKLYIFRNFSSQAESYKFEGGVLNIYQHSELRDSWEFWKWLRPYDQYLDIHVMLPARELITKKEGLLIYQKHVKHRVDENNFARIRIFTQKQLIEDTCIFIKG